MATSKGLLGSLPSSRPDDARIREDDGMLVQVVGAAVVRDGRVLACRRTQPVHLAGLWEFPGGKVEDGESDREALRRELSEELGVEGTVGDRLGPELRLGDSAVMRVYWVTLQDGGEPQLHDHDEHRWLSADELGDVPWIPADAPVLKELAGQLRAISRESPSGGAASRSPE
jgi:8-oxo-dGTP diphosphatase